MLRRKMWRDLLENKTAYLACAAVIAIGLMVFVSMSVIFQSLSEARESFYRDYHFADGFARVRAISESHTERLALLEGIDRLEGRLVRDARVHFPDRAENVFLRLVSVTLEQDDRLNNVLVLAGRLPSAGTQGVLLDPDFMEANGLEPGSNFQVLIHGEKVTLHVTGSGYSPEFIYAMRTPMDVFPDPATFGIAYLCLNVMQELLGQEALNDLSFTLADGYTFQDVEDSLETRLEAHGLEALYARKDQTSEAMLSMELQSLQVMVSSMPLLFLAIAAIILYILLKRMVEQQRGQIGTLKAFGFSNQEILLHYLTYALVISAAGGLSGGLLGSWLTYPMMAMYETFFNLPGLTGRFSWLHLLGGLLFSIGFGALAGYLGAKGVLALRPAEAMRPAAPPMAKRTLLEGWHLYWNNLNVQGKMATRNLFRNKARSFLTVLGVMSAFSLIATTGYFLSMFDVLLLDQFTKVQTHDIKVVFNAPADYRHVQRELARLPGINRAEAFLEAPAKLKHGWLEDEAVILGIEQDSILYNLLDSRGERVPLPPYGIALSQKLAESLQAELGDRLEVESPFAEESPVYIRVSDIVPQHLGINAYMELEALSRLLGQNHLGTAILLAATDGTYPVLKERYRESPLVFAVEGKGALLQKFNEMMESYGYTVWLLAGFGLLTAFAVIYNSGLVSLSERKRELASLRVLGLTSGEVLQVLTFEQWFISLFGILAGVPATMLLIHGMADAMESDLFSFPVLFEWQPFIIGTLGTAASIWLTHQVLAVKVRKLSMVEVLKERD